jgi:hypothetical protein
MKALIAACAMAVAFSVAAGAQDSTVKSRTRVKADDDARTMVMTGCLQAADGNMFMLSGAMARTGDDLTSRTKTKTDIDRDKTKVKSKTTAKVDDGDRTIGTAGATMTYAVEPRAGVDLASHVGQQVEIAAVMLDPARRGDDDAKVKIEDRTKTDVDDAPDSTVRSKTKLELPRGATARLMAISVKQVAPNCTWN